jgi:NAD(P)-dependent dehydrogenase (short-subunit alcohol dehydrogenase family)
MLDIYHDVLFTRLSVQAGVRWAAHAGWVLKWQEDSVVSAESVADQMLKVNLCGVFHIVQLVLQLMAIGNWATSALVVAGRR